MHLFGRHLFQGHHGATKTAVYLQQLPHHRHPGRGCHDGVTQQNGKRLIANMITRTTDGIPQPVHFLLPHIVDVGHGSNPAQGRSLLAPTLGLQRGLQRNVPVKMLLDGPLVTANHNDDIGQTGLHRLFHHQLDDRRIHHRYHFLGYPLTNRQKTRTIAGRRNHRLGNGTLISHLLHCCHTLY
ncbi:MAG: hypothetical protein BWY72_00797 [Bacteroidetes bacterium ADurb.Bin416]|nr:MAG: hypothetical protein BWY72_00797 [Bacteroidetes bacterium ADurb.Bin416]